MDPCHAIDHAYTLLPIMVDVGGGRMEAGEALLSLLGGGGDRWWRIRIGPRMGWCTAASTDRGGLTTPNEYARDRWGHARPCGVVATRWGRGRGAYSAEVGRHGCIKGGLKNGRYAAGPAENSTRNDRIRKRTSLDQIYQGISLSRD